VKAKPKREGSLRIPVPFEEAMKLALRVKPPEGGWAEYEKKLKASKKKRPAKRH
jgi:hypothetical protein